MLPRVLILIVSYNSSRDISSCLDALDVSSYSDFQIAICENGDEQAYNRLKEVTESRQFGFRWPISIYKCPDNIGFAGGLNYLLDRLEKADMFWILNPDTLPGPDTLEKLVARLAKGDCGAVGHDIYWENNVLASCGGRWDFLTARGVSLGLGKQRSEAPSAAEVETRSNYLIGASMLISGGFISRAGRMREDYFLYCEEVEWCLRALEAGERLGYAEGVRLVHLHGTSTGGVTAHKGRSRLSVYLAERARILLTRDVAPLYLPIVVPVALVNCFVRFARRGAWPQVGYAVTGWAAGVLNRRGRPRFLDTTG